MDKLLEIKYKLILNENLYLHTINKNNGWEGVASFFTNGEDKIAVFEGNGDGSDDKDLTFDEFIKNYNFEIRREG